MRDIGGKVTAGNHLVYNSSLYGDDGAPVPEHPVLPGNNLQEFYNTMVHEMYHVQQGSIEQMLSNEDAIEQMAQTIQKMSGYDFAKIISEKCRCQ